MDRHEKLAEVIRAKSVPVLLFIGRKDCAICQRSQPYLESFLHRPQGFRGGDAGLYSPEGLLYHVIQQTETRGCCL